jgi:hypothetical protein
MSEWQPIETAPNDAADVLFYCEPYRKFGVGDSFGILSCFITEDGSIFHPTHWMPLPEPPK